MQESDMREIAVINEALPAREPKIAPRNTSGKVLFVGHRTRHHPLGRARSDGSVNNTTCALNLLEKTEPSEPAIREQLSRMLQSPVFVRSVRLSRFLRFIVENVIDGGQNVLKEYVIGLEVYDRGPSYNPSQDSIVRTEARRLRGKLKEYYETQGKNDPICICMSPGSYIPVLRYREVHMGSQSAPDINDRLPTPNESAITIAILPFHDLSGTSLSAAYARGIPDELAFKLMQTGGCRVISPASMAHFCANDHDVATAMSKAGAQIAYEGSVRGNGNHIRVTGTIADSTGILLWTKRFDVESDAYTMFTIEEQIASVLSVGFDLLFGHSRRSEASVGPGVNAGSSCIVLETCPSTSGL
jgi:TolB-like protein